MRGLPLQLFHGGAHKCRCKSRKFHQTIWFGSKNRLDGSRKNVVCLAVAKWSFHRWNFGVRVRSRIWVWVESLQTWMASDYTRPQLQVPRWILSEVSYLVVPGYIWKRVPWYPAVNSLPCSFEDPNPSKRRWLPCPRQQGPMLRCGQGRVQPDGFNGI